MAFRSMDEGFRASCRGPVGRKQLVMTRYLMTLYRWKWLFLLTLLIMLGGSALGAYYLFPPQYTATARIWVDGQANGQDASMGLTVSKREQDALQQLTGTDSFLGDVLKPTPIGAQLNGEPRHDQDIMRPVRKHLKIETLGPNTVVVSYAGRNPAVSQQIVQGTLDHFQAWITKTQADLTTAQSQKYQQMMQNQLDLYKKQMEDAQKQVNDFLTIYPNPLPTTAEYQQLQELKQSSEAAAGLYATVAARLAGLNTSDALATTYQSMSFRVLDSPVAPVTASIPLKQVAEYIALTLVASFGLVAIAIILLTWRDTAVRTVEDVGALSDLPVLAIIPGLKSGSKRERASAIRDKVGVAIAQHASIRRS
jgi:capsular polysaccharide biosynthesis protein